MGLGRSVVSSDKREPRPPARMTTFTRGINETGGAFSRLNWPARRVAAPRLGGERKSVAASLESNLLRQNPGAGAIQAAVYISYCAELARRKRTNRHFGDMRPPDQTFTLRRRAGCREPRGGTEKSAFGNASSASVAEADAGFVAATQVPPTSTEMSPTTASRFSD